MSPGGAVSGAAIVGLGLTDVGKVFGRSPRRLAAEAVRRAADDAGLAVSDLDGLLVCPGVSGGLDIGLAAMAGFRDLRLLTEISSYGASAGAAVQHAALAVGSGAATAVACVFADNPLRPAAPAGSAFGGSATDDAARERPPEWPGLGGLRAAQGFRSVTAYYALAARRHMATYGTTSEQLGAVAVAQRQWAAGNPRAQLREPMTLADHQKSRWIVEPLHLLDCCLVSNGAVAVVITSAERARALRRPPVHIWGWGQGHPGQQMERGSGFGLVTGAAISGLAAMRMAGIAPSDVTMCQLYDCYTYTVVISLEDYGLCAKGEGGPFAASGALAPGGSLACNTGGGQLSAYYMWGFTPLSEAIIQARGDGGRRQANSDVILVSGNGGILAHHSTLILSPHAPGPQPRRASAPRTGRAAGPTHEELRPGDGTTAETAPVGTAPGNSHVAGVIRRDSRSGPFFDAAAEDRLLIKRCAECGRWLPPDAPACPGCGAADPAWAVARGHGSLVSWAGMPPATTAALVELEEGPWLFTQLDPAPPGSAQRDSTAELRAGMSLSVRFVHPEEGESYPVFSPSRAPVPPRRTGQA